MKGTGALGKEGFSGLRCFLGLLGLLSDVVLTRHTARETGWGLKLVSWSLLMQLGAILLGAGTAVVLRLVRLQGLDFSAYTFYVFFLGLPAQVLTLVAALVFLLGFSAMYRHRGEPGSALDRNLRRSALLLVVAVVAVASRWVFSAFAPAFFPSMFDPVGILALQRLVAVTSSGLGIVVALLLASLLYYVVVSLAPVNLHSRLRLAVLLLVLGAVVSFALALISLWVTLPLQDFNEVFVAPAALAVLLFWSVYRVSARSTDLPPEEPLSS